MCKTFKVTRTENDSNVCLCVYFRFEGQTKQEAPIKCPVSFSYLSLCPSLFFFSTSNSHVCCVCGTVYTVRGTLSLSLHTNFTSPAQSVRNRRGSSSMPSAFMGVRLLFMPHRYSLPNQTLFRLWRKRNKYERERKPLKLGKSLTEWTKYEREQRHTPVTFTTVPQLSLSLSRRKRGKFTLSLPTHSPHRDHRSSTVESRSLLVLMFNYLVSEF